MSDEQPTECPECGAELIKEPYEEYMYCPDCGWGEDISLESDLLDMDDGDIFPDEDEEVDTNFDPEAGEDA